MRTKEQQEQVETLLSEIELLIASERLQLEFDNSRLARAILALHQLGVVDKNQQVVVAPNGTFALLIPKE